MLIEIQGVLNQILIIRVKDEIELYNGNIIFKKKTCH